jgi:hypothetical protein
LNSDQSYLKTIINADYKRIADSGYFQDIVDSLLPHSNDKVWSSGHCLAHVGLRAPRQPELQHHRNNRRRHPTLISHPDTGHSFSIRISNTQRIQQHPTMAAMFSGAPPQGGPGYSFKQTPTAVPSGERQHGFYPYDDPPIMSYALY